MTLLAHKTKANTPATTTKAPTIAKAISKILEQVFLFVEDEVDFISTQEAVGNGKEEASPLIVVLIFPPFYF